MGEVEGRAAELRNQMMIIKSSDWGEVKARYQEALNKQRAILEQLDPVGLLHSLEAAAQEVDDEAEELSSKFLSGGMTLEEFLAEYQRLRVAFHSRDLKR